MTSASNFTGTLDLYNGVLDESGGGMTMQAWVPAGKDELIVNVTGANPATQETADLHLWSGRSPTAAASGAIGSLAQTWVDNSQTGSSGQTFGAMAAITAGGTNVTASVVNSTEVQVSFTPNSNGSFRVVIASPDWTGGNAATTASTLIGSDATTAASTLLATQSSWWNSYWANAGLIEATSSDGTAAYMENLRTLYLYDEAASMHSGDYPGSQAGVADMFAYDQDQQDWYPAGYWLWNLRGQIAANMSSGNFSSNLPIFSMYLDDLPAIESWTSAQMGGKAGACVPETMRFNGNGYYNGGSNSSNASCAMASSPSYNALNIASGPEIAMDIWQQYQDTGSLSFLQQYYPVMEQAVTFLLEYQSVGSDGFLHAVANAHESQWAVQDPTDDIAADQALFPAVISAATLLNTDSSLVSQLRTAENEIEPYARVSQSNLSSLLNSQPTSASAAASVDAGGSDVIGDSYQPSATIRNSENIGLEPVWPYGVIGDSTTVNGDNLSALADRTYNSRPNTDSNDWSYDAVDAARLDMGSQVSSDLVANTEKYQTYISGLAAFNPGSSDEPYIEQASNVATAMDEALATDYDGTLRIAPAWPSGWNASGTVYIQGGSKVDVQVEGGVIATAAIQAGTTETMTVRNPWPGQQAEVVNGSSGAAVVAATTSATLSVPVTAGSSYLIEQPSSPTTSLAFAQVTGTQATAAKHLGGKVQIGLDAAAGYASLAASFNDVGITADSNTAPGNYDGGGASFSADRADQRRGGPRRDRHLVGNRVHVPERRRREQRQHRRRGPDHHDVRQRHPRVPRLGQLRSRLRDRDDHLHRRQHPELHAQRPRLVLHLAAERRGGRGQLGLSEPAGQHHLRRHRRHLLRDGHAHRGQDDRLGHPAAGRGADLRHPGRARLRDQRGGAVRRHRGGGTGHGAGGQLRHRRAGYRLQRHLGQRQRQQLPAGRGRPRSLQRHRLR